MLSLGIETSCDETAVAVVDNNFNILSNELYSQIKEHSAFGGVVPEIASRKHIEKIDIIANLSLEKAGIKVKDIDIIAVTVGPGLIGSILVGLNFAKGLAYATKKPLYPIHHIEGHILSLLFDNNLDFPFISLVASGGHTNLFLVNSIGDYTLLGKTLDDAAGEAFDKVAKMLNLGYPGGPIIEKLALKGKNCIKLPQSFIVKENLNFSFSGIKTSVLNFIKNNSFKIEDLCASFQNSIAETFIFKLQEASRIFGVKNIALAGGVSCNSFIRNKISEFAKNTGKKLYLPSKSLSTDNAAMIAAAGISKHSRDSINFPFDFTLNAKSRLNI